MSQFIQIGRPRPKNGPLMKICGRAQINLFHYSMLQLEFLNKSKRQIEKTIFYPLIERGYTLLQKKIDEILEHKDAIINLVLVSDEEMQELNSKWRGRDRTTDVLSFSYIEEEKFICTSAAEAAAHKTGIGHIGQ